MVKTEIHAQPNDSKLTRSDVNRKIIELSSFNDVCVDKVHSHFFRVTLFKRLRKLKINTRYKDFLRVCVYNNIRLCSF